MTKLLFAFGASCAVASAAVASTQDQAFFFRTETGVQAVPHADYWCYGELWGAEFLSSDEENKFLSLPLGIYECRGEFSTDSGSVKSIKPMTCTEISPIDLGNRCSD